MTRVIGDKVENVIKNFIIVIAFLMYGLISLGYLINVEYWLIERRAINKETSFQSEETKIED